MERVVLIIIIFVSTEYFSMLISLLYDNFNLNIRFFIPKEKNKTKNYRQEMNFCFFFLLMNFILAISVTSAFLIQSSMKIYPKLALYVEVDDNVNGPMKINNKIDLDSEKVVNTIDMKENEKKVFCRCWLSGTFPMCDGSHQKHNQDNGDNVGPLIISTKSKTKQE